MQTQWKSNIDPVIASPLWQGQQLDKIALINGSTIVNHGLGRKLQGWFLVSIDAAATIYDSQTINPTPALTLVLVSNAAVNVSLWVY